MRLRIIYLFVPLLAMPVLSAGAEPLPPAKAAGLSAGGAKVDITPPAGTPLAGFGKRKGKPSAGTHDRLYARALALSYGHKTFVFVSADLVLIDEKLRRSAIRKIRARFPSFENENLVLFATHNHSGTGAIGGRFWERFIMGKFRRPVFEQTSGGIAEAAAQAIERLAPAAAEAAETDLRGLVENRMDKKINYPASLRALRFTRENGEAAGYLVFMAAHATMLPASNLQFSGDFPGAFMKLVEESHPGAVGVFANGAAADLRPHAAPIEDRFERLGDYARQLAERFAQLSFRPVSLEGAWQASLDRVELPRTRVRPFRFFRVPAFIGNRFFPRKTYFQSIRTGRQVFLAFPAELHSETGRAIERHARARGLSPFVIGYANDYIAYVVPRRYYRDFSHYEAQVSFYGPKLDWFVEERAIRLVEKVLTEEERKSFRPAGERWDNSGLAVLRLRGDAYHLGVEEGRLLKKEIKNEINGIFSYLRSELPVPLLNRLVFAVMLNHAWKNTEPYVSYEEYLQLKGIAKGSGVSFWTIRRLHALPELFPTWCTNGAYWGKATAGGRLIALRNLDWNRKMGIQRFAAVKYLETPGQWAYANIGYAGFAGVLSGLNGEGISVGQIGATSKDESLEGVPMPFLLKRILQESGDLRDVVAVFERSPLTRGYNYIFADALDRRAIAVEATRQRFEVFGDNDAKEALAPYSLPLENAVFRGDPALDPAIRDLQRASGGDPDKPGIEPPTGSAYEIRYVKHGELVKKNYGALTPETAQAMALELAPGSNIQSVVYAFPEFWVANAEEDKRAAESGYVRFDFGELSEDFA